MKAQMDALSDGWSVYYDTYGTCLIDAVLDYFCGVAHRQPIFFLWRPFLRDPGDDHVLELAVAAGCEGIVTYNMRDFRDAEQFGIRVLEPAAFLKGIGALK